VLTLYGQVMNRKLIISDPERIGILDKGIGCVNGIGNEIRKLIVSDPDQIGISDPDQIGISDRTDER
jgi:hypothetical protein